MRTILILAAMAVSMIDIVANAQPTAFEVATIKLAEPGQDSSGTSNSVGTQTLSNMTLRECIRFAWHLQEYQLSGGPNWVDTQRYEIVGKADGSLAKLSPPARPQQMKVMLQNLLKERFRLVLREEEKSVSGYALTVAKTGFKLKPVAGEAGSGGSSTGRGRVQISQGPIARLAEMLASQLGRPVVDRTGVEGFYRATLTWTPDDAASATPGAAETATGPSLFAAIQDQFGLKLESAKVPVAAYVIERAEKPNAN